MSAGNDNANNWKNPTYVGDRQAGTVRDSLLLGHRLRERVRQESALGTFVIELPDPGTITVLALAGFDFAVLDMEHSATDFSRLEAMLNAGRAAGLPMLVRPWGEDSGLIGKVLDMGAHGIMAPHVGNADRARDVVAEARYAPRGRRGFSPLTRFGALREPLRELDESTYVVAQIEGREALQNVSEVAAVPGLDAIFVGPYDLALSLDVLPGSDQVVDAAESIVDKVPGDLDLGIYVDDPASSGAWQARGFRLQCVSFDSRMLADGARTVLAAAGRDPGDRDVDR